MSDKEEISASVEQLLSEIRTYLRAGAAVAMQVKANQIFSGPHGFRKAMVYQNLDGAKTQVEIEKLTTVPQPTISRWTQDFVKAGLATPPSKFYQNYRALFTLEELGIENIDKLKKQEQAKAKKEGITPEEVAEE